jgi:alpha-ketoglutarate-dependent taurine dioxygenase
VSPGNLPGFRKDRAGAARAVQPGAAGLVAEQELVPGRRLPLLLRPLVPDVDLAEWARGQRELLESRLLAAGAILFRGFDVESPLRFQALAQAICDRVLDDNSELPRSQISGKIYAVSYAPPGQAILWHNENTFCASWPLKLWFYCRQPAPEGGETPIVDNRQVLAALDPAIREAFERLGIMYCRNYGRGLDFTWQTAFQTEDRQEVERLCGAAGIDFEWRDGDALRTRAVRRGVARHPKTGEPVWFNQACLWHHSCAPAQLRSAIGTFFRLDELPRHCCFGDGSPIPDAVMAAVCTAYREAEVVFPWQRGDVLMIDNMLTAHARRPFSGPREILAALGEPVGEEGL